MGGSLGSRRLLVTTFLFLAGLQAVRSVAVMSVDIGAEWMKVAVVSPGVPMEIALNPESKRKTSVAVSIKDGERKFGSDAMTVCVKSPRHCYVYLLDLLGKKLSHPLVQAYQARFPQYNLEADPDRGTVLFRHDQDTTYSVEELLGMVLAHARSQAETFTEQAVKDVVITTPVFFNQAERLALVAAAQLGGLNVLQLMNTPLAVALKYGMFRRKEINGTVKNIMFYDMGAQSTTATIVGFQVVKTKERGFAETHPQAQILGVGYDRTLGGAEMKFRLREYLADEFNAMKKTKTDVRTVPRAMGKLLKEAERAKLILSANTDCYAQIENVMEDIDFKVPLSRNKLMELSADLMERVTGPLERALSTAGMSLENIDQVILVGGGSRVPRVQELLQAAVGSELGKSLNTDESAAMGAVYRSADISTGFKVKKFLTKDAVILPIDVDFEREIESEEGLEGEPTMKKVRRTLFSRMNPFPQKKIMTFNKHVKDFKFNVNYADLAYLGETEVSYIASLNLTSVLVKGVKEALDGNAADNIETKGVKAHFQLDDSGILTCTSVESVFEKTVSVEEQEKKEKEWKEATDGIDWSKLGDNINILGDNIKNFFGSDEVKDEVKKDDNEGKIKDSDDDQDKNKKADKKESKKEDKETKKEKEKAKEPKKPKVETVKVDLTSEDSRNDIQPLFGDTFETSKKKLEALLQADLERVARETAFNELQSYAFDLSMNLDEEDFQAASTEEERESLGGEAAKASEWLDEEAGVATPLEEFTSKLKVLRDLAAPVTARLREHKERPEALEMLRQSINSSNVFLEKSRELLIKPKPKKKADTIDEAKEIKEGDDATPEETKSEEETKLEEKSEGKSENKTNTEKQTEEGLFKDKELDSLKKKISEVEKWRDEKLAEQEATPLSEMPKLTVSLIKSKIQDLDGEVQFLIQKARMLKAEKERAKRKAEADEKKAEEEKAKEKKKKKKKTKEDKEKGMEADAGETKLPGEGEDVNQEPQGEATEDTTEKKPEPDNSAEPVEEESQTGTENQSDDTDEPEHTEL